MYSNFVRSSEEGFPGEALHTYLTVTCGHSLHAFDQCIFQHIGNCDGSYKHLVFFFCINDTTLA